MVSQMSLQMPCSNFWPVHVAPDGARHMLHVHAARLPAFLKIPGVCEVECFDPRCCGGTKTEMNERENEERAGRENEREQGERMRERKREREREGGRERRESRGRGCARARGNGTGVAQ